MQTISCRLVGVALALAPMCSGQLVVDPAGGGHFTDLQMAIDSAVAGTVIRVVGGIYESLSVSKSLTIIGDPAPLIASATQGLGVQPPGLDLVGTGVEHLVLANVVIRGLATFPYNAPGAGIRSSGFADIRIYRSEVRGHEYPESFATGLIVGAPGIEVNANDAPMIWIADSDVRGSSSGTDGTPIGGDDGAAAIDAPGATVVAVSSVLVAGDGSDAYFISPPSTVPCPCPWFTGAGGDVVVAARYFATANLEVPGDGGDVFYPDYANPGVWLPWGSQSGGVVSLSPALAAGADVVVPARMALGKPWSMSFLFASSGGVVLAGVLGAPTASLNGTLFLDPAVVIAVPFGAAATSMVLSVPIVSTLGGAEFAFQVVSNQLQWSRPVIESISF